MIRFSRWMSRAFALGYSWMAVEGSLCAGERRRLSDKAGFFSDTRDLILKRGGEFPQFGPLYDVRVAGDAATGLTTMTTSFEKSDETGIKKVYTTDVKTHRFRRINGRWFVGD